MREVKVQSIVRSDRTAFKSSIRQVVFQSKRSGDRVEDAAFGSGSFLLADDSSKLLLADNTSNLLLTEKADSYLFKG